MTKLANATRRRRRWLRALALLLGTLALLAGAGALALQSTWFWRSAILPQVFGKDYAQTLHLGEVTPGIFPLRVQLRDIALRAPDADRGTRDVLRIDELFLALDSLPTPGELRVRTLRARNVVAAQRIDADGNDDLRGAFEALFSKYLHRPAIERRSSSEYALPSIGVGTFDVQGFKLSHRNESTTRTLEIAFESTEPWTLTARPEVDWHNKGTALQAGVLDRHARLFIGGKASVSVGGTQVEQRIRLRADVEQLRAMPNSRAVVQLLVVDGTRTLAELQARVPLGRISSMPGALPLEDISVALPGREGEELASLRGGSVDPLTGDARGTIAVNGRPEDLLNAVHRLVPGESFGALRSKIMRGLADSGLFAPKSRIVAKVEFRADASLPFARPEGIDDAPPPTGALSGRFEVTDIPFGVLGGGAGEDTRVPSHLVVEGRFEKDDKPDLGSLRFSILAERTDRQTTNPLFLVRFGREGDLEKGVRLQPFDPEAMRKVFVDLGTSRPLPQGLLFPTFDEAMGAIEQYTTAGTEFLRVLALDGAALRFTMDLRDEQLVRDLIAPIFGELTNEGETLLDVTATYRGLERDNTFEAALTMTKLQFAGFGDSLHVGARANLVQRGRRILARELFAGVRLLPLNTPWNPAQGNFDLALQLSRGGPRGELGPPAPSYLDLNDASAHIELQVETLDRDLMQLLLRMQTFDLSETLARPLYRRILDLLGLNPENPRANAGARVYLRMDLGETHRVDSIVRFLDLAPETILAVGRDADTTTTARVDATLEQSFELRRREGTVAASKLALTLTEAGGGPIASLALEGTLPAVFDWTAVERGAAPALLALESQPPDAKVDLWGLLRAVLDAVRVAQEGIRSDGTRLVLRVPDFRLALWAEAFASLGIPIAGGTFAAELSAALKERGAAAMEGTFVARDLRIGEGAPIPQLAGTMAFTLARDTLALRKFEAKLSADSQRPESVLRATASATSDEGSATATLEVERLNGALLDRLGELRALGLQQLTAVLDMLPIETLRRMAGDAEASLRVESHSEGFGARTAVRATQELRGLRVLPTFLQPLDAHSAQALTVDSDGVTVSSLVGTIAQSNAPTPLLEFSLDAPLRFVGAGTAKPGADATFAISGAIDIDSLNDAARRLPVPFLDRRIESGRAEISMEVSVPGGVLRPTADRAKALQRVHARIDDLRFEGVEAPFVGILDFSASVDDGSVRIEPFTMALRAGDRDAGVLSLSASHNLKGGTMGRFSADLSSWNTEALRVLPPRLAGFIQDTPATLDATLAGEFDSTGRRGSAEAELHIHDVSLASPKNPATSVTMHMDASARASWDLELRRVSLLDGDLRVHETTATVARVQVVRPAILDIDRGRLLESAGSEGGRIEATIGPLDLRRLSPLIEEFGGVPLEAGSLSGMVLLEGAGGLGDSRAVTSGTIALDDGLWRRRETGALVPLSSDLRWSLTRLAGATRLDALALAVRFPKQRDREDNLSATGRFDETASPPRFDLQVASDGIQIDRLLELAADLRPRRRTPLEAANPEDEARTELLSIPHRANGAVNVRLQDLRYRWVTMPELVLLASLQDGIAKLGTLTARFEEGAFEVSGLADFNREPTPIDLRARLANLEAAPWIASFFPELGGRLRGKLSAEFSARSEGTRRDDLARSLDAQVLARLDNGYFDGAPLKGLLGDLGDLSGKAELRVRDNRAIVRASTPRDGAKDLRFDAVLRPLFPKKGERRWLSGVADLSLATIAGPLGREEMRDGVSLPRRQRTYGGRIGFRGPLDAPAAMKIELLSVQY